MALYLLDWNRSDIREFCSVGSDIDGLEVGDSWRQRLELEAPHDDRNDRFQHQLGPFHTC